MKFFKHFSFLVFISVFLSTPIFAAVDTSNPMLMMQTISDNMLNALKKNRPRLKRDPNFIHTLVNRYVLPYVDVMGMSRSVIGRTAWQKSTSTQQKSFSKAFTQIVVKTYASALNAYKDETINFSPLRGGFEGKQRIQIQSQVIRPDGPSIPVNYRLAYLKNQWRIYDLNVEGVGLLQSFRAQFASKLSQGKNLTQITKELEQRR